MKMVNQTAWIFLLLATSMTPIHMALREPVPYSSPFNDFGSEFQNRFMMSRFPRMPSFNFDYFDQMLPRMNQFEQILQNLIEIMNNQFEEGIKNGTAKITTVCCVNGNCITVNGYYDCSNYDGTNNNVVENNNGQNSQQTLENPLNIQEIVDENNQNNQMIQEPSSTGHITQNPTLNDQTTQLEPDNTQAQ
ncbi:uncharacterized protein LOC126902734 [Daktulosphaira vitifoliae]|uniref:uncharacterized protein LOC126902734 n=1 Tax=Daktulosphaira vitifoliae TaxID=58002 RepID=UPI0021AAEBCF|nr:uncharacterized protein LOC126902734 [Daktulosphaira vitifoliae]